MIVEALELAGRLDGLGPTGAGLRLLVGTRRARARRRLPGDRVARRATRTRDAIAWAREHLPEVAVRRLARRPAARAAPTARSTSSFAISIWSHFGERAALRWLDEMHRLLAPGGHLVLTTHGPQSIAYYGQIGAAPAAPARADPQRALPARLLVRARVRRGRRPRRQAPRVGNRVPDAGVAAAPRDRQVGRRALRGRPQHRQPGRDRAAPSHLYHYRAVSTNESRTVQVKRRLGRVKRATARGLHAAADRVEQLGRPKPAPAPGAHSPSGPEFRAGRRARPRRR